MTKLDFVVERMTPGDFAGHGQPLAIHLVPSKEGNPLLILRLKGRRAGYVVTLADVYRVAAMWHGNKEKAARTEARRNQIPWRIAKKKFYALPPMPRRPKKQKEEAAHA